MDTFGTPPDLLTQFSRSDEPIAGIERKFLLDDCRVLVTHEGVPPNSTVRVLIVSGGVLVSQLRVTGASYVESEVLSRPESGRPDELTVFGIDETNGRPFRLDSEFNCSRGFQGRERSFEYEPPDAAWLSRQTHNSVASSPSGDNQREFAKDQWIYAATDGLLKAAAIDGDKFETPRTLTSTDNKATFVRAVTLIPSGSARGAAVPEVLVLWLKNAGTQQEVHAHLFTPAE